MRSGQGTILVFCTACLLRSILPPTIGRRDRDIRQMGASMSAPMSVYLMPERMRGKVLVTGLAQYAGGCVR